jgi:hypothetical protein
MSGFRPGHDTYQLTSGKAIYWHRRCNCGAMTFDEIFGAHAIMAGFDIVGPYSEVAGPGLAEGNTDPLYQAIAYGPSTHSRGTTLSERP